MNMFTVRLDRSPCKLTQLLRGTPLTERSKSLDPSNQVFAIIRSRATAGLLEELAAKRKNIHILVTDLSNPKELDETAAEVSKVTNGSLDILLLNAGSTTDETAQMPPSGL